MIIPKVAIMEFYYAESAPYDGDKTRLKFQVKESTFGSIFRYSPYVLTFITVLLSVMDPRNLVSLVILLSFIFLSRWIMKYSKRKFVEHLELLKENKY